ncbi:hypothetical protein BDZ90DRAFT_188005 [Jaminaea rosea]|uniref:Uncharacterized protein n=1 Tax=Jaminaea rosea TaxID=1569628 RepID=A0A316UPI5_9BASI|nr:hypothetical protein BDZ90DRAFT_188005 [Jaminaea rosea]PWN27212.1 hypothetical protein BDZ90DRAFT_188005 [Jaminaea rosea]
MSSLVDRLAALSIAAATVYNAGTSGNSASGANHDFVKQSRKKALTQCARSVVRAAKGDLRQADRVARPQSEDEVDLDTASDVSISSLNEFILAGARKAAKKARKRARQSARDRTQRGSSSPRPTVTSAYDMTMTVEDAEEELEEISPRAGYLSRLVHAHAQGVGSEEAACAGSKPKKWVRRLMNGDIGDAIARTLRGCGKDLTDRGLTVDQLQLASLPQNKLVYFWRYDDTHVVRQHLDDMPTFLLLRYCRQNAALQLIFIKSTLDGGDASATQSNVKHVDSK